jgi:hypothetical protein
MRKYLALAALVGARVMVMAPAGMAASVAPVVMPGNPSCPEGTLELKIEPVESGTFDGITIIVDNSSFSFTSTVPVTTVIVKGGPNANVYTYPLGTFGDTGLTAPINPNNNRPYGLSHVSFCTEKKPPPPPK